MIVYRFGYSLCKRAKLKENIGVGIEVVSEKPSTEPSVPDLTFTLGQFFKQ